MRALENFGQRGLEAESERAKLAGREFEANGGDGLAGPAMQHDRAGAEARRDRRTERLYDRHEHSRALLGGRSACDREVLCAGTRDALARWPESLVSSIVTPGVGLPIVSNTVPETPGIRITPVAGVLLKAGSRRARQFHLEALRGRGRLPGPVVDLHLDGRARLARRES